MTSKLRCKSNERPFKGSWFYRILEKKNSWNRLSFYTCKFEFCLGSVPQTLYFFHFTWHCLPSPWSPQLSDTEHMQCSRKRIQHPPWCLPQYCTSLWPPASGVELGCRAWCSQATCRGSQTCPDHWQSCKWGRGCRNWHSSKCHSLHSSCTCLASILQPQPLWL